MSSQPNQTTNFTTFADWCLHKDSLSQAARYTFEMLLNCTKTSDCYEADRILSTRTSLTLYHHQIVDISPLSALTNLTYLYLNNNYQLADISPLSALTNLTQLHLNYNQIEDISPLSTLTNLTELYLNYNYQIVDITSLSSLTKLTSLELCGNQIADISPVSSLTNLTYLSLFHNQITDISLLSCLTYLTYLNLNTNQIADISPLKALTKLKILYLNNNSITDLSPLQSLDQLNSVWIYGVDLPKKYFCHQHQWQSQWLLSEDNAEVRQLLIQTIGYDRICQELQATELDSWCEYTLLKIDIFDDFDDDNNEYPTYLLKMTCPSTGHIHALRVPPDMKSAREAIRWVNWGIDPEEFAVQT